MQAAEHPDELLISRVVERTAGATDWVELERLAALDSEVWERLAATLRQESLLSGAVEQVGRRAQRVRLAAPGTTVPRLRLTTLGGWVAAALFALLWTAGLLREQSGPAEPSGSVRLSERVEGDDGQQLLRTLPTVLVGVAPDAETGELEVILIRRTLERAEASGLRELCVDELGRPVSVPVSARELRPIESL